MTIPQYPRTRSARPVSRRAFLTASVGAASAALLAACGGEELAGTATRIAPTVNVASTAVANTAATVAPTVAAAGTMIAATVAAPAATTGATGATAPAMVASTGSTVEVQFFFPTAAAGPITNIITGYVNEFNAQNTGVKVTPTFAGGYSDVTTKIQTTVDGGGQPPDTAILLSTDLYALKSLEYIVPFNDLLKGQEAYIADFFPAFMLNSRDGVDTYGIPFQRSTPVMYYNKDLFREVGLDPEKPPATWAAMVDAGRKLVKTDGSRWGVEIPSDGFPYWVFQGMAIGNGKNFVSEDGKQVFLNDPAVVEALQAWVNLGTVDKVAPASIVVWGTTPDDFASGRTAIAWHTTGSLTDIVKKTTGKFALGVGNLPGLKGPGAPTGGGNFYLFRKTPAEKRAAAFMFIQYMTSPQMQARWTTDSGYVAARKSAWETATLKDYTAKVPQALVARDQLMYAQKEFATYSGPQVQKAFSDELQAALTGKKTTKVAMDDAQRNVDTILKQFR